MKLRNTLVVLFLVFLALILLSASADAQSRTLIIQGDRYVIHESRHAITIEAWPMHALTQYNYDLSRGVRRPAQSYGYGYTLPAATLTQPQISSVMQGTRLSDYITLVSYTKGEGLDALLVRTERGWGYTSWEACRTSPLRKQFPAVAWGCQRGQVPR